MNCLWEEYDTAETGREHVVNPYCLEAPDHLIINNYYWLMQKSIVFMLT
jgi:hypothetical protein